MRSSVAFLILALSLSFTALQATPAQVMIIRHAEKPDSGDDLSLKGYERAHALMPYFLATPQMTQFGLPVAIYAQCPTPQQPSQRAVETVTPLADVLGFPVNTTYERDQYPQMVQDVLSNPYYDGKAVLVCWEHNCIPEMAHDLGALDAPNKWASHVFDRVWLLTYSDGNVFFEDAAQQLMYGDSSSWVQKIRQAEKKTPRTPHKRQSYEQDNK